MEAFISSLRQENAVWNSRAELLRSQSKADEAVFCTVRANVYDICATVCGVWAKKGDIAACEAVLHRFEKEWGAALEAAKRQENAKQICVEETKLEALRDVLARFQAARCG